MCGALAYSGPSGSGPDMLGAFCFCMFGALAYSRAWCVWGPRVFGALACSGRWRVRGRVGHLRWGVLRGWLGAMAIFSGRDYFRGVGLSRSLVYWMGVVG